MPTCTSCSRKHQAKRSGEPYILLTPTCTSKFYLLYVRIVVVQDYLFTNILLANSGASSHSPIFYSPIDSVSPFANVLNHQHSPMQGILSCYSLNWLTWLCNMASFSNIDIDTFNHVQANNGSHSVIQTPWHLIFCRVAFVTTCW